MFSVPENRDVTYETYQYIEISGRLSPNRAAIATVSF